MADLRVSTLQSRLAQKQDNLKRKIIDNVNLRNVSSPVDCVLLKMKNDYRGDSVNMDVQSIDVIPAVFPAQTDIPFRKISLDTETNKWQMSSFVASFEDGQQEKSYTLQVPWNYPIDVDDLIFRVFIDDDIANPTVICLQVRELVGDFGGLKMIMQKVKCTIPTDNFPPDIVMTIYEMAQRRLAIAY